MAKENRPKAGRKAHQPNGLTRARHSNALKIERPKKAKRLITHASRRR